MKGKWKAAIAVGLPVLAFVCGVAMLIFGMKGGEAIAENMLSDRKSVV